jgi:hypothetical protein
VNIHSVASGQSGIACGTQISKDFSFANWLATLRRSQLRWQGMRTFIKMSTVFPALLVTMSLHVTGATPEQEKAFTDKYKKAFEAKDTATLQSFLYTQGADPAIVGFYKMMQSGEAGQKISNIELVALTPEDAKKAATPMDSPTGGQVCLTLKPTKKLIIKVEKKDADGSSSSTSENFIAEKDGKFVIPVPGPCK